ncbi:hypothetical protein Glove_12g51 [Diversispora epigaea]|uniref:Uncharacterized protein n=1 Tax=Diversispora epigaea TaxID=1348612 RepID=A0A397JP67_9GLOM|nr:hypothetical protein Glove_12g51 [Diversispora epigaea]
MPKDTVKVNELYAQPNKSQFQPQPQISITRTQLSELRKKSLFPITRLIKPKVEREHLEPINKMFKKTFHNEVLQIFEQIPKKFLFDVSKTFSKQKEKVIKELISFIKKLLNPHIKCYDNELLKQGGKYEAHVHRQHANLRREQKIKRRKKGLQHLIKLRVEREHLEPINKIFKKTLHDEVLQIFEQIPKEFLFDVSKTFSKQKEKVIKELIPFIKKLLNPHIKCYDNELLKQGGKYEAHVHRQHANLRREQKIKRRKKGLQHLIKVTDPILEECQPSNIDNKTYIEDLYRAINENKLQSKEDEERFEIEKKRKKDLNKIKITNLL